MEILVIVILLVALLSIWIMNIRRKMIVLDENVGNAMGQIGIQLSSGFDALMALLNLTKEYVPGESRQLMEFVKVRRSIITAQSTVDEVREQERIIKETLELIERLAEQEPELGGEKSYANYLDALDCHGKMLHTGRLIYNDSVTKFNREVRRIPAGLVAGMLGFREKSYLGF